MLNDRELIEWIEQETELGDLRLPNRGTEYVRARAVAIKLITERGARPGEIARRLHRDPKTIRHAIGSWATIWAHDAAAKHLYEAGRAALAG